MATPRAAAGGGSAPKTITTQFRGSELASDSKTKKPVLVVTKKAAVNLKSSDEDIETARRKGDNECARHLIE
jgi:hypothetical protein